MPHDKGMKKSGMTAKDYAKMTAKEMPMKPAPMKGKPTMDKPRKGR